MKKVYYAHFMGIYNTPQELRDIKTLHDLNLEVLNPNTEEIQKEVEESLNHLSYMEMWEKVFTSRIETCDVFAFKALPDGRIPGGVAMELKTALKLGLTIIELPSGMHSRFMGKDDTREYLRDIGQR